MSIREERFIQQEKILKALANRRRLAIVHLLSSVKEASVGEIARIIKLSFGATSRHLLLLADAGVLEKEQRSILCFYSINKNGASLAGLIISSISKSE